VSASSGLRPATADETHRCAQFLYLEAALLDGDDLTGWSQLLAPDVVYWIPLLSEYRDPEDELNIVYDDMSKIRPPARPASLATYASGSAMTVSRPNRRSCCMSCARKRRQFKRWPVVICTNCARRTVLPGS
jgi:3-phenylpropionate/cinnamic acid dioxygenase small subunit